VAGPDVSELAAWLPLAALALVIGLWPSLVLGLTAAPVDALIRVVTR
jgi:NADH-quinone oxidoreductase subunit M